MLPLSVKLSIFPVSFLLSFIDSKEMSILMPTTPYLDVKHLTIEAPLAPNDFHAVVKKCQDWCLFGQLYIMHTYYLTQTTQNLTKWKHGPSFNSEARLDTDSCHLF